MDLPRLIEALSAPAAYPHAVDAVEVRQTHISAVFLAGDFVYKVKKPVNPGFLDFTTLEKRHAACRDEVRLNRRLAPDVYLGVVPIVQTAAGVRVECDGEAGEWAVKMRRLPDAATLLERLRRGEIERPLVEDIARRVAAFHRAAEGGERVAAFGRFEIVARNFRDVFERAAPSVGKAVSRGVFDRVRALAEDALARLRPLIESRAARGVPRDCHGDLHLDHVYCFPERTPPEDLVVIDCIEFNEQFRFGDPVADAAFAVMDFAFHGRRDLARAFADAYFLASGDAEGRALLPLYAAYRAAVRGMVDGLLSAEDEVSRADRAAAAARAKAHWLLTLCELEPPGARPCLLLVCGLPGTGKSTLARELAERGHFEVIRSDVVRKELAGLPPNEPSPPAARESLYTPEWTAHTYAECLARAERLLSDGQRVIVDANFRERTQRQAFRDAAVRSAVPFAVLVCEASAGIVRSRLEARKGDASDATWDVYLQAARRVDGPDGVELSVWHTIDANGTPEQALAQALAALQGMGLIADQGNVTRI